MARYKIALLPGDGIGNDVMEAGKVVLDALRLDAEYITGDIGWEFWRKEGNPLPERTLDMLRTCCCALFGAITSKPKDEAAKELDPSLHGKGYVYQSPIVRLRQEFDLYINLRPCKAYPGNQLNYNDGIDLVVFRENTEGLYSGVEFHPMPDDLKAMLESYSRPMERFHSTPSEDIAMSCRIFTRRGCRRILHAAFDYARKHHYPSVAVIEKPNVIRETSGLMIREAREIAKDFPSIELWEVNVDAMAMWLIKNPLDYHVLVTSNMFGDIISDLCAQLVGGLGFAASGNIGDTFAVFEPTHGSAPKYSGHYKVNPVAMIISIKMMLDYLQESTKSYQLDKALSLVIKEGKVKTYDMGGNNSTLDVAKEIARQLS